MDIVTFLEEMAKLVENNAVNKLLESQPEQILLAYKTNNIDLLKKYIHNNEFITNPTDVVQF